RVPFTGAFIDMDPPPPLPTLNDMLLSLQTIIESQQEFRHDLTAINTEINQLRNRL
ncbi:hypothetical protein L195_g064291, partial [Trifolium pratense]